MSLIGNKLKDRYYIIASLAKGGFGHTYIAEDHALKTKQQCVIKHLNPVKANLPHLPRLKKLFEREANFIKD